MLAIAVLHQVNRLLADDTDDVTTASEKANALADQNLWVPATDRRDVNESVVVDVLNDQPNFVEMTVEHDRRRTLGVHFRHAIASDVGAHMLRESRCLLSPDAARRRLVARWS